MTPGDAGHQGEAGVTAAGTARVGDGTVLVLGLGNMLLTDDGVGPAVIARLMADGPPRGARLRDGGTMGLDLLPEIEGAAALVVVDAAELGAEPGTLAVLEGRAMDAQLGGKKRTAHEVSLADLMGAAALTGCRPARRALVAVQPGGTGWGLAPTRCVAAAIGPACLAVTELVERWRA
jgi:hydrogenase maturation protease